MINIDKLNQWQKSDAVHPFTCGSGRRTDADHLDGEGVLLATESGWQCPYCSYRQEYRDIERDISQMPEDVFERMLMRFLTTARPVG